MCLGAAARVPGLAEEAYVLDVDIRLDPSIVGQSKGRSIVRPHLHGAETTHEPAELRAVVQAWNERSLRLSYRLGFGQQDVTRSDRRARLWTMSS